MTTAEAFKAKMGSTASSGDEGYDRPASSERMFDRRPALRRAGAADVIRAVSFARGIDWRTPCARPQLPDPVCDQPVIDLCHEGIRVDLQTRNAWAQQGSSGSSSTTDPAPGSPPPAAPTFQHRRTHPRRRPRLLSSKRVDVDNLVSADVVTADGRL
jgi:hypothetical protein